MKALVFKGQNQVSLEDKPVPGIESPSDAIVRITYTTICGTDLHILKGDVPTVKLGRTLGHEGVGRIHQVGGAVSILKPGDPVLIRAISSCAACDNCRKGIPAHCSKGGWLLGHTHDGTQAEYVRIPFADYSLLPVPDGVDEEALVMFSDILPTAQELGTGCGHVRPGCSLAIIGAGPVGLASILTSRLCSPSKIIVVDKDPFRLDKAKELGATHTFTAGESVVQKVKALTNGTGCDTVIEAVGIPETFDLCQDIVAPGGTLANIGVHGTPCTLKMHKIWGQNISITTGLVNTVSVPMLLKLFANGQIPAASLLTHEYALKDIEEAYSIFMSAAKNSALKITIIVGK